MSNTSIHKVWPTPFRKIGPRLLQKLDDDEFSLLCQLVYRRTIRHNSTSDHAHKLVRRMVRKRNRLISSPYVRDHRPRMLLFKYKSNEILDSLYPARRMQWLKPAKRRKTERIGLDNFSFVDSPNRTMHTLYQIARAECQARDGYLDFHDTRILDIGPYVVLGIMSRAMAPFLLGGSMDIAVKKVIEAVDLRSFMGIRPFKSLEDDKNVWAFRIRQRHPGKLTAEPERAIGFSLVADQLVDTVDDWLAALPRPLRLTQDARGQLNKLVTEMLDNAERHGGVGDELGDWYVAGFMARRGADGEGDGDRHWYDCHIAFVNLGHTIADTIQTTTHPIIRRDLDRYLSKHRARQGPSGALLASLYAMQDGVSSIPDLAAGMGMMEMVQLCNELGGTEDPEHQPAITIISGRSCIRFAGPYKTFLPFTSGLKGRRQPFNRQGEFELPPDNDYVFDLDYGFPGTIVAARFSLDHEAMYQ